MFDATRLQVFREVIERGSFSAAAEALSFTQPAVSRQIAALEREAGAQLVERLPRGVRPTEAGRVLAAHAEAILERMAAARSEVEAVATLQAGRLRIGAFPTANATVVPQAIATFAREHPAVELMLLESISADLIPRLRAGELDVTLATDPLEHDLEGLAALDVVEDPMLVALSRDHLLARKPELRLRDLREESWIEGGPAGCRRPLFRACAAAGFEPHIRFGSEQWLGKQGLVAAGVGVTLIPGLAVATVREDIVLRSLGPDAPVRRVVAVLPERYRAPAAEPFVDLVRERAEAQRISCYERDRLAAVGMRDLAPA
ncbi:MAG TPA: LysR substrate-binding domain-containing protein [Solirubrobacteraceae bacterium]|nr:LysR substrate-binding domain-containing protein [Solirubrobacteraceae bacterium]